MQTTDNTITLATNLGRGGVCAFILSGESKLIASTDCSLVIPTSGLLPEIQTLKSPLKAGELQYGKIKARDTGELIDEVVVAAIDNYTRIISGHGGTACTLALLDYYTEMGFTEIKANTELLKAEQAIPCMLENLLINCKTDLQTIRVLEAIEKQRDNQMIDLPELQEFLRPRIIALAGAPNVGKSSILNRLCGYERVLVSSIAGTTRDAVKDYIDINGYFIHLVDTAGFRDNTDDAENEAISKGKDIITEADLVLFIIDNSRLLTTDDHTALNILQNVDRKKIIPLLNKKDLPGKVDLTILEKKYNLKVKLEISCTTDQSLERVFAEIDRYFTINIEKDSR